MKPIHLMTAIVAVAALMSGCGDSEPPAPRHVTVSVDRAETAAVPGRSLTLAWRFALADGWHLYADALNDSGFPPGVTLDLPEGWTAEEPLWPPARRHVSPGDILDHVYEDEVVLLQRVVVDPHAELMTDAVIEARISWLACLEACVPGDTTLTVTLPIRPHAAPSLASPSIVQLRRQLPRDPEPGEVTIERIPGEVRLRVPGAARLEFHPAAEAPLVSALADAASDGETLALRLRDDTVPVRGTLRIATAERIVSHVTLEIPAEGDGP